MATKETSFVCDCCNAKFETLEQAQACEDIHLKVTDLECLYAHESEVPDRVRLTLETGRSVVYEIMRDY